MSAVTKQFWIAACFAVLLWPLAASQAQGQLAEPAPTKRETLRRHAAAGLAGLNIYSTFGCIGLTAELYEAKKFDAAKVQQITADVVKTSDLAVEMLKNARHDEGKAADDVPYEDLIQCYYLLDREARLLGEACKSGDKNDLQEFYEAREQTWDKVQDVLGIEDDEPTPKKPDEKQPAPKKGVQK